MEISFNNDDCLLIEGDNLLRDCCQNEPLLMCRIFTGASFLILAASISISVFLFYRHRSFNIILHLLINLTFLGIFTHINLF